MLRALPQPISLSFVARVLAVVLLLAPLDKEIGQ